MLGGVKKEPMDPEETSILTMEDLPVLVRKLIDVASKWHLLGVQLEFNPGDLGTFKAHVQDDPIQALQELLTHWLQRTKPKPTLESLAEIIGGRVIKNGTLARSLLKKRADFPSVQAREQNHCNIQSHVSNHPPKIKLPKLENHESGYGSQDESFSCKCGSCTLDTYLSQGCPCATDLFPYLNTEEMSKRELENLQAKLMADADVMTEYFADFVSETQKSFEKREVSLFLIHMHVCNLRPTLFPQKRKAKRILKYKSHAECFSFLACYWSWFNSKVLEYLIKREGSDEDKERATAFDEARMDFLKRKIFEIPHNMYGVKREKNTNELVLKLDDRYSVTETDGRTILEVKTLLHRRLSIRAELLSIKDGCLELTFQIPEIWSRPLSNRKKQLLAKKGVESIIVRCWSGEERNLYPGTPDDVRVSDASEDSPRRDRKRRASSPPPDSDYDDDSPYRRFSDPGSYDEPRPKSIKVQ